MGNRGYRGSDEHDGFSRKARRALHWKGGQLSLLKRSVCQAHP
jgi:hypothetical protein